MSGSSRETLYRRRGTAVLYTITLLTTLTAIVSLGVDFARVQLAKTELQSTVDSAARYAAAALAQGVAATRNRAISSAAENGVDGSPLVLTNSDIEFGIWDPADESFTVLTGSARTSATAVRVTGRRIAARNTGVPTIFARVIGRTTIDVQASAIAARGHVISPQVPGDASPWLAGMPNGSIVPPYDGNPLTSTAPSQSPLRTSGLTLSAGTALSFRQATGTTGYSNVTGLTPDGDTSWIVRQAPVNGINATRAPLNCLVGIFLDDRTPSTYAMAAEPNFTTPASRDFTSLSPALKQVFFIGDGVNSSGALQTFIVPGGTTRFYLGIMDEKGWWWDNTGVLSTTMLDDEVTLVK